nr:ribonuclease H-like domain, reverse transcriptase, RNA-dependent DNA polymerase [Tanacetum cinerariifolium]
MGELTFFLGLQVKQKKDGIFISQDKYVAKILKKFGFTEVKTASTPIETQNPLLKDEIGKEVNVHMYRLMIGLLIYLTSSRPDIMFAFTVMAKTINGEAQLHVRVDGKKTIITEASIRRDLQLADEEGVDCLPNSTIFEQLALIGVLELENTKTSQHNEIASLKRLVKKIKKRNRSRTHKLKRLYKVGLTAKVESSNDEESLDMFDVNVLGGEEVFAEAGQNENKLGESTTTTTISSQQSQDNGKGIMREEPVKPKKNDQIRLNKEAAKRLQAEFDKEARLAREEAKKEQEANIALNETWNISKQRLMLIINWLKECKHKNKKSCLMLKRLHYFNNS